MFTTKVNGNLVGAAYKYMFIMRLNKTFKLSKTKTCGSKHAAEPKSACSK